MSEEAPQPEAEKQEPVASEPKMFDEAYVKQLREEAASNRVKLKEYEDRDKTDADKATERIAELERENAGFKSQVERGEWLRDAAKETGLPVDALDVIRGDDRDSFIAAAQKLKALIPESQKTFIPGDAESTPVALNGEGIESALRNALGI